MEKIRTKILTSIISFIMVIAFLPAVTLNADSNWSYNPITHTLTISYSGTMPNYTYQSYTPWYKYEDDITKIVIENGTTSIGNYAFSSFFNVKEIVWPTDGKLTSIGKYAFYCTGITEIVLPTGITTIGESAFGDCDQVTKLILPSTLKTIGSGAFCAENGMKFTSLSIPSKVTSIGTYAFARNTRLTTVTGGAGLVTIGSSAFLKCSKLATFKITSPVLKTIGSHAFEGCSKLKTIYIQKTTKLTKKTVKKSLCNSKVKTVKVKKSKVKTYKKYFTSKNCGRYVTVKK